MPGDIRQFSAQRAGQFRTLIGLPQPIRPQFGHIWSTEPDSPPAGEFDDLVMPRLVVVLEQQADTLGIGQPSVLALPVSLDLAYQSDRDLRIPESDSPLGYAFMIEAWNEVTMLRTQLVRYLGALPQPFASSLGRLYRWQFEDMASGDERASYESRNGLAGYMGPAITDDDDPRVEFQEDEVEACEYLRRPLLRLLSERVEGYEEEHETVRGKVIQFPNLPVQRGRVPTLNVSTPRMPVLAAASDRDDDAAFVRLSSDEGTAVGVLHYDFGRDSLYLTWEELPPPFAGKTVLATVVTTSGQSYVAVPAIAQSGHRFVLAQGSRLVPKKVSTVSFEFVD